MFPFLLEWGSTLHLDIIGVFTADLDVGNQDVEGHSSKTETLVVKSSQMSAGESGCRPLLIAVGSKAERIPHSPQRRNRSRGK